MPATSEPLSISRRGYLASARSRRPLQRGDNNTVVTVPAYQSRPLSSRGHGVRERGVLNRAGFVRRLDVTQPDGLAGDLVDVPTSRLWWFGFPGHPAVSAGRRKLCHRSGVEMAATEMTSRSIACSRSAICFVTPSKYDSLYLRSTIVSFLIFIMTSSFWAACYQV